MPPGTYLGLTRPGAYPNEWGENQNLTFNDHQHMQTTSIDSPVKPDKNMLKESGDFAPKYTNFNNTNFLSGSLQSAAIRRQRLFPPKHLSKYELNVKC